MKNLKKFLKIIGLILILLLVSAWLYSKYLQPKYEGELEIKNLSDKVTVHFDDYGVPHINANNQEDAYIALGYLHAQERLWQMELIRRIAPGRLSEIFGKDLLKTDRFFCGLGIEEAGEIAISKLDKTSEAYLLTQKYLDGINQFIEDGKTPLEFTLVGIKKEKYTIKDVYNVFGYMAFSFAVAHKTDPLLTEIKEKLGDAYLDELMSTYNENLTIIKTDVSPIKANLSQAVNDIMKTLPVSTFIGSNSWVIGAEKTKNGKVIFENDPHIGYSQPSVWYQNHIKTPDFEIYGFNIALMPFPLLGHNKKMAYGLTMLANDDLNFYIEENNPANSLEYKTKNGYQKYKLIEKSIKIKDAADTTFTVKVSKHGPIMNGLVEHIQDEKPIAMYWIYNQLENKTLDVVFGMSHSKSLSEFKKAAEKIHAPGLNVMYGDSNNNIAWFASAKLYELRKGLSSRMYLNGASGEDEIVEYLSFDDNPKAINPSKNYVYSANNQPDSVRGKLYQGYYQPQDRAKRIVQLLDAKNDFTKDDVAKMTFDVTSATVSEISKNLLNGMNTSLFSTSQRKVISILEKWDGNYLKEAVAPTIYNRFLYEFLVSTYKDELGESFKLFINSQLQDQAVPSQITRQNSVWWDDISTKNNIETKKEIIEKSFKNAFIFLQNQLGEDVENWKWERVVSVEHEHPIGKKGGLLGKFFNVGPFKTIGGNEVINNQIFSLDSTGVYKITAGPSTRRIIDFSDVENSLSILPTGQSGNVFSKHYKDQAKLYLDGKFIKMEINASQINSLRRKLVLLPKK